uniref:Annexin n=1 Tax=Poecilia latipinna TaxID=48699 RepID=A0A3B3VUU5_9TELE
MSSMQDMWWGTLGTIRPFPNFHPDRDAADIQAADVCGLCSDAAALVRILTNRNNAQRQAVAQSVSVPLQDLSGVLKKVLSGELEELLLQLVMLPEQLEAQRLKAAMAGLGTDEETLLEILCSRSRKTLQEVAAVYRQSESLGLPAGIRPGLVLMLVLWFQCIRRIWRRS